MNKVLIAGYIGNDVELRYTTEQKAVANFSVGTRENKDKTEWHKCIAWDKTAEFISKYFKKGSFIIGTGHLQTRKWEDKDGKTMYSTEVVIENAEFGGSKKEETKEEQPVNDFTPPKQEDLDLELPF